MINHCLAPDCLAEILAGLQAVNSLPGSGRCGQTTGQTKAVNPLPGSGLSGWTNGGQSTTWLQTVWPDYWLDYWRSIHCMAPDSLARLLAGLLVINPLPGSGLSGRITSRIPGNKSTAWLHTDWPDYWLD